jgi:hypothetical protein
MFKDSPERCEDAAAYLRRFSQPIGAELRMEIAAEMSKL